MFKKIINRSKQNLLVMILALMPVAEVLAEPIIMGYWENWATYVNFPMPNNAKQSKNAVLSDQMAHLNALAYAFLEVAEDGAIQFADVWSDLDPNSLQDKQYCQAFPSGCEGFPANASLGNFAAFSKAPVKHHVISVGGGGYDRVVERAFDHPDRFVASLKALMAIYQIDALDIDYEPPQGMTLANAPKMIELTRKIKEAAPALIVSYAISANRYNIERLGADTWKKLGANINYISIMGYDIHGSFDANYPYTALHSALVSQSDNGSVEITLKALVKAGIAKNKIILGMPLYGRAVAGVKEQGLGQIFTHAIKGDLDGNHCSTRLGSKNLCSGVTQYKTLVDQGVIAIPVMVAGQLAGVYAYQDDKKVFISFDNPDSAAAKAQYAINNQLAGVMFWALRYDTPVKDSRSVLAAVAKVYENQLVQR